MSFTFIQPPAFNRANLTKNIAAVFGSSDWNLFVKITIVFYRPKTNFELIAEKKIWSYTRRRKKLKAGYVKLFWEVDVGR